MSASALAAPARSAPVRLARRLAYDRDVVLHLVRTELAVRQRGSFLGWLWALGPPLAQLAATYLIFTRVIPLGVEDYPVFLLVGVLSWSWFSASLADGTLSLEVHRDLVLRPGFAIAILPLAAVLVALVDYALALPVLFSALAVTRGVGPEAALLPVLLAVQLVLCVGLALLFAPLQVFFRDVRRLVTLAVTVGFWLTPVFYRRTQVPGGLRFLYEANPMAHLIEMQRRILLQGALPGARQLALVAVGSLAVLVVGGLVFARSRHSVPEQL